MSYQVKEIFYTSQGLNAPAHLAQVHHHARLRIGCACDADLSVVGVAMHAQAAFGLYLAAQGVGGVEKKLLADAKVLGRGVGHERPFFNRRGGLHGQRCSADAAYFMGLHTELPHRLLQAQVYAYFGIAFLQHIVKRLQTVVAES